MPSTVVHVALAGLVGTALLAEHFDGKAVLVVMAATAFIDLDVFVGLVLPGTHRAAFHTLLLPGLVSAVIWWDLRGREHSLLRERSWVRSRSRIRSRWGARGVRVSWVSIVAVTLAGIGPDLFFNGVNLFYPVHDQFFDFSGKVLYSNQRGVVQTMIDLDFEALFERISEMGSGAGDGTGAEQGAGPNGDDSEPTRTTENTHYRTGVDPARGEAPEDLERIFPLAMTGERALLAITGYTVVGLRLWMDRRTE
jgi:hypothetical protein